MEPRLRVLYDGWPLIYQPLSPSALHLWEVLHLLPEEVDPIVALPDAPPPWFGPQPASAARVIPQADTPAGRLRWEQRILPRAASELGAGVLHLTHSHPPLVSEVPVAVSPTEAQGQRADTGFGSRMRASLGKGGMARGINLLWPSDLPIPGQVAKTGILPPAAQPVSRGAAESGDPPAGGLDLPEGFILYHGSFEGDELHTLFEAWTWGAGALGDHVPLLLLGAPRNEPELESLGRRYQFGDALRILPSLPPPAVPELYRRAAALIHPGVEAPWGGAVRRALACGLPVVTIDHPANSAIVGPAAFTAPAGDTRRLGAGLITVIVEEEVARRLSEASRQRAAGWSSQDFRIRLGEAYRRIAGG